MPKTYTVDDQDYEFPDTYTDKQVQDILTRQGVIKVPYSSSDAFKNMGKGAVEGVKGALTGPNPITDPIGFVTSTGVGAAMALDTLRHGTREEVDKLIGSLGAQALLGKGMSMMPGVPEIPGTNLGPDASTLARVGGGLGAGVKAGGPAVARGAGMVAAGELASHIPGMEWPARIGLGYPGFRQMLKGIGAGAKAYSEYGETPEGSPIPDPVEYPNRGMLKKQLLKSTTPSDTPGQQFQGQSSPGIQYNPAGGGSPSTDIPTPDDSIPIAPEYPNRGKVAQQMRKKSPTSFTPGQTFGTPAPRIRVRGGGSGMPPEVTADATEAPDGVNPDDWDKLHPDVQAAIKMGAKVKDNPQVSKITPTPGQPITTITQPELPTYMQEGAEGASQMSDPEMANRDTLATKAAKALSQKGHSKQTVQDVLSTIKSVSRQPKYGGPSPITSDMIIDRMPPDPTNP